MNLARLLNLAVFMNEADPSGAGGGGGLPSAPPTDTGGKGGEGGAETLTLRDEIAANIEIQEKGPDAKDTDLSDAARRLRAARKGHAPAAAKQQDDAALKAKQEGDDKAKREAELAKLKPEERAAREAEDKKKADEAAAAKLDAPTSWSAADREMFAKQTPEAKAWLLRRHGEMEKHFQKVTQDASRMVRMGEVLDEVFKPHDAYLRQAGMTREQALRELVGWKERLDKNPADAIAYLAQISGVDLKKMIEGAAAADPAGESPTVKALRATVENLNAKLAKFENGQTMQQQNAVSSQVQSFVEEKDDQGKLKHPYFYDVVDDMNVIIRGAKAAGKPISLQDAYDRAVRANPATHEKWLAARDADQRAKEEAERKAKAEAARKAAAANIEGEGAATAVAAKTGSVREDLEAAFAEHGGRV